MKREIKFRAWTYGWEYPNGGMVYNVAIFSPTDIRINDGKDNWCKLWDKGNWVELTSKSVMQFTGLKDKNGKEIYENDLVSYKNRVWEVKYYNDGFNLFEKNTVCADFNTWWNEVEIIGNIYENSELLKK